MSSPLLDAAAFRTLVDVAPLVSIDFVVTNPRGQVLLGLRSNRPAKGFWFVPGGRIRKGETLDEAYQRLTRAELGVEILRSQCHFLGVYEHFYDDSVFGATDGAPSTHYVVLGYQVVLDSILDLTLPQDQHVDFRWFELAELLDSDAVHSHTKAYAAVL